MIKPMLATDLAPDDNSVRDLLFSDEWIAERKYDGQRVIVTLNSEGVHWQGRSGLPFNWQLYHAKIYETMQRAQSSLPLSDQVILDGEAMSDGSLIIFDCLIAGTLIARNAVLKERIEVANACARILGVEIPDRARDTSSKVILLDEVIRGGYEGIVLKRLDSPYTNSRSAFWRKVKITATADLIVRNRDDTSCTLMGLDEGKLREFGRAAIYPNVSDQMVNGLLVEVRYLYVSDGGRLVQPRIKSIRTDKSEMTEFTELRQKAS